MALGTGHAAHLNLQQGPAVELPLEPKHGKRSFGLHGVSEPGQGAYQNQSIGSLRTSMYLY